MALVEQLGDDKLRSLLCLCDIFQVLINSFVCWLRNRLFCVALAEQLGDDKLRSLMCLCYIFQVLINSFVCWLRNRLFFKWLLLSS